METAQGYLLDLLEEAVEEAFQDGCEKWLTENDFETELFAPSGAVAIKYGVGVEGSNMLEIISCFFL